MQISINGQLRDLPSPMTIEQLLREMDLHLPYVAVELNKELVPREQIGSQRLQDGDRLEIVTLVGGG